VTMSDDHEDRRGDSRTLRQTFGERRIAIASMDRHMKLATAGALGCMVGAAVLVAGRDIGGGRISIGVTGGVATTLSTPLFDATLALLAIGMGYLVSGIILADRAVALIALLVVTGLLGFETGILGLPGADYPLPSWAAWATRGLLVAIWVLGGAAQRARRSRQRDSAEDHRLRMAVLFGSTLIMGGYLVILRIAGPAGGDPSAFATSVTLIMVNVGVLATPLLQVAATDFAEWGELSAERLHHHSRRSLPEWAAPAAGSTALVIVGIGRGGETVGHTLAVVGEALLLLGIGAAVGLAVSRGFRLGRLDWPERFSPVSLLVVTATSMWLVAALAGYLAGDFRSVPPPQATSGGAYTSAADVRTASGPGGSTLLLPETWRSASAGGGVLYIGSDGTEQFKVLAITLPSQMTMPMLVAALGATPTGTPTRSATLVQEPIRTGSSLGYVWTAPAPGGGGTSYVIYGYTSGPDLAAGLQQLEALAHSFRPAGQPPATVPPGSGQERPASASEADADMVQTFDLLLTAVASLVAVAAVGTIGRKWTPKVRATAVLFGTVTLFTGLFFGASVARVVFGPATSWPVLTQNGTLIVLGGAGLCALYWSRRSGGAREWTKRLPGRLAELSGGILAVVLMNALYSRALSVERIALWAPIILLVAVAWDVTMSGETLTNVASRRWPRSSRVLVFFGYTVVLGATVVFYSGQRAAGNGSLLPDAFIEPEAITRDALWRLAVPAVILLFVFRTFGRCSAPPDGHGGSPGGSAHQTLPSPAVEAV
jgi:hypothetical protein